MNAQTETHTAPTEQTKLPARATVSLEELRAEMAAEVASVADRPSELVPTRFHARVAAGIVEIEPTYVSGIRPDQHWTATIDPGTNRPRYVKSTLFWSYSEDDAGWFNSPEEALAAAKRVS